MRPSPEALRALSELFVYPEEGYVEQVAGALVRLGPLEPSVADAGRELLAWAQTVSLDEAREVFARTFDLGPATTLDLGWHVFGESYKRGALLVGLREELRSYGMEEGTELPDHLPLLLRLLAAMPESEDRELLRRGVVGPGLRALASAFHGSMHPHAPLLRAAASWLAADIRRPTHLPVLQNQEARRA